MSLDFDAAYRENLPAVWRYVQARLPAGEAEDATSEVFARALRTWDRYDPARGSVGAWLMGVAHHTVVDWHRRAARPVPVPPERVEPGPEERLLQEDLLVTLHRALSGLTEREREALALRFSAGLTAREAGDVLGLSEGAFKMVVHRAVTKLREVVRDA